MKKSGFRKICLCTGIGFMAAAVIILLVWQWNIRTSQQRAADCVQTLRTIMPESQGAALEARRDNTMAVFSLDGTDFAGILEIPRYALELPVCADWGKISKYPCCLDGSIYDGTLQIGATTQTGQFDFYRQLSAGDAVFFTDMEGNRYGFTITDLRYEKHADQVSLRQKDTALTLFIKNIYAFEYLILFCNPLS